MYNYDIIRNLQHVKDIRLMHLGLNSAAVACFKAGRQDRHQSGWYPVLQRGKPFCSSSHWPYTSTSCSAHHRQFLKCDRPSLGSETTINEIWQVIFFHCTCTKDLSEYEFSDWRNDLFSIDTNTRAALFWVCWETESARFVQMYRRQVQTKVITAWQDLKNSRAPWDQFSSHETNSELEWCSWGWRTERADIFFLCFLSTPTSRVIKKRRYS